MSRCCCCRAYWPELRGQHMLRQLALMLPVTRCLAREAMLLPVVLLLSLLLLLLCLLLLLLLLMCLLLLLCLQLLLLRLRLRLILALRLPRHQLLALWRLLQQLIGLRDEYRRLLFYSRRPQSRRKQVPGQQGR